MDARYFVTTTSPLRTIRDNLSIGWSKEIFYRISDWLLTV